MSLADDDPRHGTARGYDYYRCHCASCREAKRLSRRRDQYKARPSRDGSAIPFESLLARDRWLAKRGVVP